MKNIYRTFCSIRFMLLLIVFSQLIISCENKEEPLPAVGVEDNSVNAPEGSLTYTVNGKLYTSSLMNLPKDTSSSDDITMEELFAKMGNGYSASYRRKDTLEGVMISSLNVAPGDSNFFLISFGATVRKSLKGRRYLSSSCSWSRMVSR